LFVRVPIDGELDGGLDGGRDGGGGQCAGG
jgi:hypothetical protein